MTSFPQLSNFLFSPRHRRGLSRFGQNVTSFDKGLAMQSEIFREHAENWAVLAEALHASQENAGRRIAQDRSSPDACNAADVFWMTPRPTVHCVYERAEREMRV
jgi:hypothetical protein